MLIPFGNVTHLAIIACSFSCFLSNLFTDSWVIKSSPTREPDSRISIQSTLIALPSGQTAPITHVDTREPAQNLKLENVLDVLSFQFNLLSVSKLIKQCQYLITFYHD